MWAGEASLGIETGDQMELSISKPFFEILQEGRSSRVLFQFLLNRCKDLFGILEIARSVEPIVFEAARAGASIRHAQSDLPSEAVEEIRQEVFFCRIGRGRSRSQDHLDFPWMSDAWALHEPAALWVKRGGEEV